jgi:hypothetical protein
MTFIPENLGRSVPENFSMVRLGYGNLGVLVKGVVTT